MHHLIGRVESRTLYLGAVGSKRCFTVKSPLQLVSKHAAFLDLVRGQGDAGDIHLRSINANTKEIVINNAGKKNSINGSMMNSLAKIVDSLENEVDDSVLLLIRGEGDTFCSGADLNLVRNVVDDSVKGALMSNFMTDTLNRIRNLPLISICLVNGHAIGGGAELSTVGDYRIMFNGAYISFVQARLGASTGWGGGTRLTKIVGRKEALKLLATSTKVTSEEASRIGLADHVCSSRDSLVQDALQHFGSYLVNFPKSVRALKTVVTTADSSLHDDIICAMETKQFSSRWGSDDNKQAIKK
jgi:ethylmalonyl-CoA/methylmalonyl-CoA decarboxylase